VTKDEDFSQISLVRGFPPKIVWLITGNCTTAQIDVLLHEPFADIINFEGDEVAGVLLVG